jgi:diguanylate cyclase (GGDEF)-like protein/PAS domain S-box-containing protein
MAYILVVDDTKANRDVVATLLSYKGHRVIEAADGIEALSRVRAEHPDLVICDMLMPTMDGYEFVRRLRAEPSIAHTAVVYYTAYYHEREARNLAGACGVLRVITKPCEPEEMLRIIDEVLGEVRAPAVQDTAFEFDREHLRLVTDKLSATVDDLQMANRRLAALTELNLQLASERDARVLLDRVCRGARDLLGAKYAVVCVNGRNQDMVFLTSGIPSTLESQLELPKLEQGLLGETVTLRRAARATSSSGDPASIGLPEGYPAMHCALVAPVMSLSHAYGWICLVDKLGADEFTSEDEQVLSILSAQTGRIYENGMLYNDVQRQAEQLKVEIAERKRAIEELRASEAGLNHAQSLARLTHVVSGPQGDFESWSEGLPGLVGIEQGPMIRSVREWLSCVHPEDRATFRNRAIESSISRHRGELEYRFLRADGQWLHIRHILEPIGGRALPRTDLRWFNTFQDVTEQKRAVEALRESDRRFIHMLENVQLASLMLDGSGRITYCNDFLLGLTDWRREEVLGQDWFELFVPPESEDARQVFSDLLEDVLGVRHFEHEILTRAGVRRLIRWSNTALRDVGGAVTGMASIGEDITEQKEAERRIKRLNRVYAVLSGINTLIVRVHERDELFRESCRIAVELGQFKMAWIGLLDRDALRINPVASASTDPAFLCFVRERFTLEPGVPEGDTLTSRAIRGRRPIVLNDIRADTRIYFAQEREALGIISMAILPLIAADEAVGTLALYADEAGFFDAGEMELLTELAGDIGFALDHIDKEERLNYLAYYDEITGLPNRTLFLEQVSQMLRAHDAQKSVLTIALLDIDRFRIINDTLGRSAGDELLRLVARRIQSAGGELTTLARVGVNCFGIALAGRDAAQIALTVEQILRGCFDRAYRLGESDLRIAAKAGIALHPHDGVDAEALLRSADTALRRVKRSVESILFFAPEMASRIEAALNLESRLRTAIERDEYVLYYQPKFSLATGALVGAEALLRWNDPLTGLMLPGGFIPLLEETGLIYEVGRWALRRAVRDHLHWRDTGRQTVRVAVNVSPLQLRNRDFVAEIARVTSIDPDAAGGLELELTESLIMEDVQNTGESLKAIRDMGVSLAIDDFGTGFSSLSYLSRLPVDTLKIDRSFIVGMTASPEGLTLVQTIVDLAHSLRLKVIAEGVETEEQALLLKERGCDEMQGYLRSKPVPRAMFEAQFLAHVAKQ